MASSTVQNVSEILTTIFEKGDQETLYEAAPLIGLMPKDTNFKGEKRSITLRYTPEPGGSADFSRAQANKNPSKYKRFEVTRSVDYVVSSMSTELYRASKGGGEGALVDALTSIVNGMKNTAKRSLCKAFYGNGGGARGVISSGVGSNVITLTNPDDIVFFEVGMQLDGSTTDGTSGVAIQGGANSLIVAIDRDAGTITNSGANWNAGTGINGIADGNFLFRGGDFGALFPGLDGWIPASVTSTAFYGVDRTADSERLAGCRLSSAGATVEETILNLLKRVYRAGGAPDHVFLHPEKFNKLVKEIGSKRTYAESKSTDASVGYRGLVIEGQGGPAKVFSDPSCPVGTIFALTMDTWKFATLGDPMSILDEDGKVMCREASADALEMRMATWGALICDAPAYNGRAPAPLRGVPREGGDTMLPPPWEFLPFNEENLMDTTYRMHNQFPGTVVVSGGFRPNGSSAVLDNNNPQATVTRVSAGLYTVSLPFGANALKAAHASLRLNSPAAHFFTINVTSATVSASIISFSVLVLEHTVSGGPSFDHDPADIAANANNWIYWTLELDNGTVPL